MEEQRAYFNGRIDEQARRLEDCEESRRAAESGLSRIRRELTQAQGLIATQAAEIVALKASRR